MKTSISFLKSKYSLEDTIKKIGETNADYIHVDIMDGKFVPNKSISAKECVSLLKNSKKPLDIHLMVNHPIDYLEDLKSLNVKYFTIHEEIKEDKKTYINLIHSYGFKAGIAINPETSINTLTSYLPVIDYIIVMGVHPGAGGQKLISDCVKKVVDLKRLKKIFNYKYEISLDGGIDSSNIARLKDLDVAISGSFVCMSDNYQKQIDTLKK